ncbi:hypothetical protein [Rossellomorea marisflavi]|uniref:hypothetical protein n=1 Tax=Rossellomorea marisflavi TaxID=189381 RepID=UPI003F9FEF65
MSNAMKCIQAVNKKLEKMELGVVTLKGVKNLSRADLDMVKLHAESSLDGRYGQLMEPRGNVREVLEKFNVSVGVSF